MARTLAMRRPLARRAVRARLSTVLLLAPPLVFLLLLFAVPLGRVLYGSVFAPDFTLAHYGRMWTVPVYGRVFWITLKIAVMTTVGCVLLGYLAAYFLASVKPRTRQVLLLCVIVPFFLDQFFWGRRVFELGVGPRPIRRKRLDSDTLAGALRVATRDPEMKRRAAALGVRIRAEDGVARAVAAFERHLCRGERVA